MRAILAILLALMVFNLSSCTAMFSGYAQSSKNKFEQHTAYDFDLLEDGQQIVVITQDARQLGGAFISARSDSTLLCLMETHGQIDSFHEIPEDQITSLSIQKEPLPLEPYILMGLGLDSYLLGILLVNLNPAE